MSGQRLWKCPVRGKILARTTADVKLPSDVQFRCPSCASHFHTADELLTIDR